MRAFPLLFLCLAILVILIACQSQVDEQIIHVTLSVDDDERQLGYSAPITIAELLDAERIELGDQDRINPGRSTRIQDGMRITIVRVLERTLCEREEIPYQRKQLSSEGLEEGQERLAQPGRTGEREICYQEIIEDGITRQRAPVGQPIILQEPVDEIVYIGSNQDREPIQIDGTLAYIHNHDGWIMRGDSSRKRQITFSGDLDSFVFRLSSDGNYLLYTKKAAAEEFINELWFVNVSLDQDPIQLTPTNVIYADWIPHQRNGTISYSTAEKTKTAPFWRALNNLWALLFDVESGQTENVRQIVPESSGGVYGWWGTIFEWSPDGRHLAWVGANSMGLVDLESGGLRPLLRYAEFDSSQPWSWRASISWSDNSELIATTAHGPPLGNEPPQNSPVFNVAIVEAGGEFRATLIEEAGMWASPSFSPQAGGKIAYLQARAPYNSISGEYDLVVVDRDGSNAKVVFPENNRSGITTQGFGLSAQNFVWDPDGSHIAVIYQGNLWIVNTQSKSATQLTFIGNVTNPVWVR